MKKVILFGATGYIGNLVLNQLPYLKTKYKLVLATYHLNSDKAKEIKEKYQCDILALPNEINSSLIQKLIKQYKPHIIINAMSGWNGFYVSYISLKNKKQLILANKESIVIGYKFLTSYKKDIIPIDSEHTALYELCQCDYQNIDEIIITASGGKYHHLALDEIKDPKFEELIIHPNWSMGHQITIDSSTMVNKFYELVEATFFYPNKKIKAIIHPQSIVHAIIKYKNNSYWLSASNPDMNLSVNLALNNFSKQACNLKPLDFSTLDLSFKAIDENRFLPIKWFNEFNLNKNYLIPIIVNIANEYLFIKFKNNEIKFTDIVLIINQTLDYFKNQIKYQDFQISDLKNIKNDIIKFLDNYKYE